MIESLRMEAQLRFVKSNKEGLKMENYLKMKVVSLITFRGMFLFSLNGLKDEVLELISINWLIIII